VNVGVTDEWYGLTDPLDRPPPAAAYDAIRVMFLDLNGVEWRFSNEIQMTLREFIGLTRPSEKRRR
jgi:hypothetical protein